MTQTTFKIRNDIPVPAGRKLVISWPWKDMKVGDSIVIGDYDLMLLARNSAHVYGSRVKKRFTTKKIGSELVIWRVA